MRFAINLPNFGPFGDPRVMVDLARCGPGRSRWLFYLGSCAVAGARESPGRRAMGDSGGDRQRNRAYPLWPDGDAAAAPPPLAGGTPGEFARSAGGRLNLLLASAAIGLATIAALASLPTTPPTAHSSMRRWMCCWACGAASRLSTPGAYSHHPRDPIFAHTAAAAAHPNLVAGGLAGHQAVPASSPL